MAVFKVFCHGGGRRIVSECYVGESEDRIVREIESRLPSVKVFRSADAFKQSAVIGLVNLVFTIVGMALIDRIGRRMLLIVGSFTFIPSHLLAAWVFLTGDSSWLAVLAAAGIVGSHAFSQGAMIWVAINELLPNAIRAPGASAACFVLWGLAIVVSTAFPPLVGLFGGWVFGFFASSFRSLTPPTSESLSIGFRVASVPEPSAMVLTILFSAGLVCRRKR